jgi:hypothetical protein
MTRCLLKVGSIKKLYVNCLHYLSFYFFTIVWPRHCQQAEVNRTAKIKMVLPNVPETGTTEIYIARKYFSSSLIFFQILIEINVVTNSAEMKTDLSATQ